MQKSFRQDEEIIKMELRKACNKYSKTQAQLEAHAMKELNSTFYETAKELDRNPSGDTMASHNEVKQEIERINSIKAEGYKIRAKAQYVEEGERCTKFFINLEKRNYKLKNMTKLTLDSEKVITDKDEILQEQQTFYEKLYTPIKAPTDFTNFFINDSNASLDENQKLLCDLPITKLECKKALDKMKNNKTPGTDGFPAEFYKYFWEHIDDLVFNSIQSSFTYETLSSEQKRAVLRLIPKKDKDITRLKNWRPISLLNTDYKLLTHILATRLQIVLPSIISKDQSGYLKNRFIGINIRSIIDIISSIEENDESALLAFLDFEKAFDKINWNFMKSCLKQFGFGENFQKWIKILYTDIESCVINNGTTSKYFKPKCGIRQGCPLSALLFIIAVETLTNALKNNKNINGVIIGNKEFKLTQLADDTTLFLKDINSLRQALNFLFMFQMASGLKLNYSKTEILQIGKQIVSKQKPFNLAWDKTKVYALGTWFYKDVKEGIKATFTEKVKSLNNLLKSWSNRALTWIGKIAIIKSLGISKLNYAISSLETPGWFAMETKDAILKFLWDEKPARIKNKVIINRLENGGLRMVHFDNYVMAQKTSWVKRLLDNRDTVPFHYLSQFLPDMNFETFLKCSFDPDKLPDTIPYFYRQVLCAWFYLKKDPKNISDIQREVIWWNKHILINNREIFCKSLSERGINYINDLIGIDGQLIKYVALPDNIKDIISNFDYMSILDAIPASWRQQLRKKVIIPMTPQNEAVYATINNIPKPVSLITSKEVYWHFQDLEDSQPRCKVSWLEKYNIDISDSDWKKVFMLPFITIFDTKIQEMQYKIIHRAYASDSYVSFFDKTVNKNCTQCNIKSSIIHQFVECRNVHVLWTKFQNWYNSIFHSGLSLTVNDKLFGILDPKAPLALNFCIIHIKWFLHCKKKKGLEPYFIEYLTYFKNVLHIEKTLAIKRKNLTRYNTAFSLIELNL